MYSYSLIRLIGKLCPPISFLEKRVCRVIPQLLQPIDRQTIEAGNGFFVTGDTSNVGYLTGLSERRYMQLLGQLIRPEQVVFDIGANTGYLALWLLKYFHKKNKAIQVVAFEPEPLNAEWLQKNITLNPWCSATAEPIALGAEDGILTLWSAGRGDGSVSTDKYWGGEKTIQSEVPVLKLDTYCKKANYKIPNWLILDVEGFGGKVIDGASKTLEKYKPAVAAEIHSETECSEIESILFNFGYARIFNLSTAWGNHIIWMVEK